LVRPKNDRSFVPTCIQQNGARSGGQKRVAPLGDTAPQEFRLSFFALLQKKHRNYEEPPFDRSEYAVTLLSVGTLKNLRALLGALRIDAPLGSASRLLRLLAQSALITVGAG
jgi:hypothetical protein